jgi:hypothetical protein
MLTAIAIVFGFLSLEARKIRQFWAKFVFLSTLILFLMVTSGVYFLM